VGQLEPALRPLHSLPCARVGQACVNGSSRHAFALDQHKPRSILRRASAQAQQLGERSELPGG